MIRVLLLVLISLVPITALAQEKEYVRGLLLHSITEEPVTEAHVINFSDSMATISTEEGLFRIPASVGDSILISSIGFAEKALIVNEEKLLAELVVVRVSPREYLLTEVEVNPFGTKAQFQKRFMELEVDDGSIDIIGVKKPSANPRTIPVTEDADEIKKAKYMLNPASFIYGNFSKDAKARQQLHKLEQESKLSDSNRLKYNEKIVSRITGYSEDDLRDFMDYCNFSEHQIQSSTEYQLTVAILARQREFEKQRSRSDR